MSGVTNQEEDKKPTDQAAHINLKVKGQVSLILSLIMTSRLLLFTRKKKFRIASGAFDLYDVLFCLQFSNYKMDILYGV